MVSEKRIVGNEYLQFLHLEEAKKVVGNQKNNYLYIADAGKEE